MTEAAMKKKLGWQGRMFYEARFEILEQKLTGKNLEKLKTMTYAEKVRVVAGLVEKGAMI